MSNKLLHVSPQRCTACRNCEMACAFVHSTQGVPGLSRIQTRSGPNAAPPGNSVVVCLQCDDAACVAACPAHALFRDMKTGAIYVVEERCIRCYSCVAACPFGNMRKPSDTAFPVKCDLCGGDPACAKFCPTKALVFE
jgi:Fe-S-cluster-containing hydrogenase component 2